MSNGQPFSDCSDASFRRLAGGSSNDGDAARLTAKIEIVAQSVNNERLSVSERIEA